VNNTCFNSHLKILLSFDFSPGSPRQVQCNCLLWLLNLHPYLLQLSNHLKHLQRNLPIVRPKVQYVLVGVGPFLMEFSHTFLPYVHYCRPSNPAVLLLNLHHSNLQPFHQIPFSASPMVKSSEMLLMHILQPELELHPPKLQPPMDIQLEFGAQAVLR